MVELVVLEVEVVEEVVGSGFVELDAVLAELEVAEWEIVEYVDTVVGVVEDEVAVVVVGAA